MAKSEYGYGKEVGGTIGLVAGVLTTIMSDPIGRLGIFTAQDEAGLKVHHFFEDLLNSREAGDTAYRIFNEITNTIMAHPAILPITVGVIAGIIGAVAGNKVSKTRLKHKSMKINGITK